MKKYLFLPIVFAVTLAVSGGFIFSASSASATAVAAHRPGALVNINGTIWRISADGASRQAIDSLEKFYSYRYSFANVSAATSLDASLKDDGILPWGDGVLFDDHGTVYQVSSQVKNPFVSAAVFLGQGFKFANVKNGNLSALPLGSPVTNATAKHLPGTFIKDASGTVYAQTISTPTAFSSAAQFYAAGGNFAEVVAANSSDGVSVAAAPVSPAVPISPTVTNSTAHSSYTTQNIAAATGTFKVEAATFDLSSGKIRVLTDSATDTDCITNCNVASLAAFVSANGGQSGMNGSYFCPTSYGASCAGKTNSYYAKVIDSKAGNQINAGIEYTSNFPFIAFDSSGKATYYSTWTAYHNTAVQSGQAAYAGIGYFGLIENGQISLQTQLLDDKQKSTKQTQGAIGLKGQTLYLIHIFNATVPDAAATLQAMGLDDAVLMDGGGSTALMYQGAYKSGPGRNIANAIIVNELP